MIQGKDASALLYMLVACRQGFTFAMVLTPPYENDHLQDLELRKKAKQLEFLWRGAKSFGKDADVFTGSFPTGKTLFLV